ncbi:Uncharacterised protein [Escherichia coli]|nr:Uncharacterised protein [Escherichia coli]
MADNNEATSSILADPYGKISHKTLDIITNNINTADASTAET